jgi:hypothetical protein
MKYFKLETNAGTYEADRFYKLVWMVLAHRFWHLRKHGRWMD